MKKALLQGTKVRGQVDILTNISKSSVNLQDKDSLSNIFKLKRFDIIYGRKSLKLICNSWYKLSMSVNLKIIHRSYISRR